ncbi:lipoprotein signal peptidase [Ginsengibacter hankyongi]|uniref:Lipoprotein signal peptidase n=1 Tax=Ginsengibacter hankyongi TaxID=2607284 RepID=A0A5J5IKU5_9BACT|nr:lipoprotein signal peptidase [Ginsengibacter hankyongi]KAA9041745.1 lipoprotein signal peptidase [Ginsengibacter hankyongi]
MKGRNVFLIICLIVIADQALKIYVKTHYHMGESHAVLGNWFRLYFIENEGMAYGWKFGGDWGKIILTLFRLAAVIFGVFYIKKIIQQKYHPGFIICAALIFSGALGNLIDSMFYGLIFEDSSQFAYNVAKIFPAHGYAGFLHGKVVDMLYFPVIRNTHFPLWVPFWGGEDFEFFRPIFNLSDAAISTGIITILVFQKRFFKHTSKSVPAKSVETGALVNDEMQVS